jgi:hypothetical protein
VTLCPTSIESPLTANRHFINCALLVFLGGCSNGNASHPTLPAADVASRITVLAGDGQIGIFGQPVSVRPSVRISDANNQAVPGVLVTFSLGSTDGILSGATQTTSSSGVATVGSWTLGSTFGTKTLTATASGLPAVTFSVTARAPNEGVVAVILVDPAGDTLSGPAGPTKAIDLLSVRGEYVRDSLFLNLNFADAVTGATSIAGWIEIDIDENVATGIASAANAYDASVALGVDYTILLAPSDRSSVNIVNTATQKNTALTITFSENSMTIHVPMSALGNDDGNFSFAGLVGTADRATDVFPNAGHVSVRRTVMQ